MGFVVLVTNTNQNIWPYALNRHDVFFYIQQRHKNSLKHFQITVHNWFSDQRDEFCFSNISDKLMFWRFLFCWNFVNSKRYHFMARLKNNCFTLAIAQALNSRGYKIDTKHDMLKYWYFFICVAIGIFLLQADVVDKW